MCRPFHVIGSVLIIILLVLNACAPTQPPILTPTRTPTPTPTLTPTPTPVPESTLATTPSSTLAPSSATKSQGLVSRVIDGDTIEIDIAGIKYKLRYIGIDTPELNDKQPEVYALAQEATRYNRKLVEGKTIRLEKDISETDKYGRLLRYVYVGDLFVNAA